MKKIDKNYFCYKSNDLLDELIQLHRQVDIIRTKKKTKRHLSHHIRQAQDSLIAIIEILSEQ